MPSLALTFDLAGLDPLAAEAACFAAGAFAVTHSDARDDAVLEPAPGEVRLWPATRVQALFAGTVDCAFAVQAVVEALGTRPAGLAARVLPDRVWELEWREHFHAMRFGRRLWVAPSHEAVTAAGALVVRLDPGLAFGTGTHATTAMCLEWLDAHIAGGERVIDYGCGSGILAFAAARLGARHVECFDIDPQALSATRAGAVQNDLTDRVVTLQRAEDLEPGAHLLVANILSGPLCELAPRFAALVRRGGRVVLAGLLEPQVAQVTETFATWFDMNRFGTREEWVGLAGVLTRAA